MMRRASGRALGLVLFIEAWNMGAALAHALPGSILTVSLDGTEMTLSISLPLEDLVLASSTFGALASAAPDTALSADRVERLAEYFADHVAVQAGTADVPLVVERAALRSAHDEHVGQYTLLVLSSTARVPRTTDLSSLTLTYDAVMHEVRNHRARVFWSSPDGQPVMAADFGYRPVDGLQQPVLLARP